MSGGRLVLIVAALLADFELGSRWLRRAAGEVGYVRWRPITRQTGRAAAIQGAHGLGVERRAFARW